MLNYGSLSDVEFEYVCQDIMSRKLGVTLRRFAPGRDGGIDLTNDSSECKIIVQVKHYMNSTIASLLSSLKKEIPKVQKENPKQYFVCCSKRLSPQKVEEIYSMFSDYMESTSNVITLNEIEDFLVSLENIDILRKHYKLWISSTGILEDVFSNDIFIDSEFLEYNIQSEKDFFVQTSAYDKALEYLEKYRCLFITGSPGVGKTITSDMLIFNFVLQGYRVRYTTDGNNLSDLKRSLSQSPDAKEIVLLDDCLGQAYFNMRETQGRELLSIISHVKAHKNKILLLNSRVTIFQEANQRIPELVKSFSTMKYKVFVIDMDAMPLIEKAKILYNHLYFNQIDSSYFEEIKKEKRYFKIVKHNNFNPRIIEFVTNSSRISTIPANQYYDFILQNLNNPSEVWEDEYTRKLNSIDRLLLTTLYSITDTTAPYEFIKQCFEYRLKKIPNVDLTLDNFEFSIKHLQKSFIKIVDVNKSKMISMVNPSVNDFINAYLSKNAIEKDNLKATGCSIIQQSRMMEPEEFSRHIAKAFDDLSVLNYVFENDNQKNGYISYYVASNNVLKEEYKPFLLNYLSHSNDISIDGKRISSDNIIKKMINPNLIKFYKLEYFFLDILSLSKFLEDFQLEDLVEIISQIDFIFTGENQKNRELYIQVCVHTLEDSIKWYCTSVEADQFDIDMNLIFRKSTIYYDDGYTEIDVDKAETLVCQEISKIVKDEVVEFLSKLPEDTQLSKPFMDELSIEVDGCDYYVESYFNENSEYEYGDFYKYNYDEDTSEIDLIFNR